MGFNFSRRDSGELRFITSIIYSVVSGGFGYAGYRLLVSGVTGEWEIVSSFKGFYLYFTSLSPGLLVIAIAACIMIFGLPKALEKL